jgi:mRNA-degrading endonuclease toxin of MazEF toxin-antitoxin module
MQTGDIVIVSFPYTDLISYKARPAVVVSQTKDNYNDVIVCLITSKIVEPIGELQILLQPDAVNNLKIPSVIKISRIATAEQNKILSTIGKLNQSQLTEFKRLFKSLVD